MKLATMFLGSVAGIAISTGALAQDVAPEEEGGLAEIVVTAQKREQNLQDVPVAVSAITGEALAEKGVSQFEDLSKVSPSLTITKGTNVTGNSINLRGIGTSAFSVGVEAAVAVIVDDLAVLQQGQAFSNLGDVERVEVLRGPQGTLFGKGASAGAINIVTKGPTRNMEGSVDLTGTTDDQYRIGAAISGPIGESAGFRVNGFYANNRGYIRNLRDDRRFGREESWGLHARFDVEPTDTLKLTVNLNHGDERGNGTVRTLLAIPDGQTIFGVSKAVLTNGITPGYGNNRIYVDAPQRVKSQTTTGSFKATLDLGHVDLISITGYQDWNFDFDEDVDVTASNIFGSPTGIVQGAPINSRIFSQEFRLVSDNSQPLQYLVGLYYGDGKTRRVNSRTPVSFLLSGWRSENTSKTYAGFAQATYDVSDTTHIDGGVRFNREDISVSFLNTLATGTCRTTACTGSASDDQFTGKIALRQDVAEKVMVYASYATGYKGQGYDISTGFRQASADNPVKAEHSKAYELGLKSRFFDNRVQLNLVGFLTDYDNFQAQSAVVNPDLSVSFQLRNVGKLRTKGVELELLAQPTSALTFSASAAYTDAKIRQYPFANCYTGQTAAQGCFDVDGAGPGTATAQNLAGRRLANAPKFKYTIGANYDIVLPSMPIDAFVGFDYRHQSAVNYDLSQNPNLRQGGYGVMNANIGVRSDDDVYRVTLFVNNLFDKAYAVTLANPAGNFAGNVVSQVLPRDFDRYFGIRLNAKF